MWWGCPRSTHRSVCLMKRLLWRRPQVLDATWPLSEGAEGLEAALSRVCAEATAAIESGHQFIVLSDRAQGARAQAQQHVGQLPVGL